MWTASDATPAVADPAWPTNRVAFTFATLGPRSVTVQATFPNGKVDTETVAFEVVPAPPAPAPISALPPVVPRSAPPVLPPAPARVVAPINAAFGTLPARVGKDGKLRLPFVCVAGDTRCTGTLTLRTAKAVKVKGAKGKAAVLKLGTAGKLYAPVGANGVAAVKVAPAALRALKALKRVPVVATAQLVDASGQSTTAERRFTLTYR